MFYSVVSFAARLELDTVPESGRAIGPPARRRKNVPEELTGHIRLCLAKLPRARPEVERISS